MIKHFLLCYYAVDHLVNNAGVHAITLFEDTEDVNDFKSVMVNWIDLIYFAILTWCGKMCTTHIVYICYC